MEGVALNQTCYICQAFFADKVKLGLHIAVCYSDALKRGITDLPPPTDLLNDDKRYTEFMQHKYELQEQQLQEARRNKVSFVTMDDFSQMRTQIGAARPVPTPTSPNRPPSSHARQALVTKPHRDDHLTNNARPVAQPGHIAPTNQRSSEQFQFHHATADAGGIVGGGARARGGGGAPIVAQQESSPARVPLRAPDAKPWSVGSPTGIRGATPTQQQRSAPASSALPAISPARAERTEPHVRPQALPQQQVQGAPNVPQQPDRAGTGVTMLRNELQSELANVRQFMEAEQRKAAERDRAFGGAHGVGQPVQQAQPVARPVPTQVRSHEHAQHAPPDRRTATPDLQPGSPMSPSAADHQRQCPHCHKTFGPKGFAVHVNRCGKHATEDFTYSKDVHARDPAQAALPCAPQSHDVDEQRRRNMSAEEWQQFMVTYPRPVLPEQPQSAAERNRQQAINAQKAAMQSEMQRAMSGETGGVDERVPCRRCGRKFAPSRVEQHESVCVSKMR